MNGTAYPGLTTAEVAERVRRGQVNRTPQSRWVEYGGILSRKEAVDARGGNSFTNWGPFTKEHEAFKAALLALPVHVIATLRTKQDYVMETDSRGKQMPKKVGLAAIQREGMEYELSIMFELQMDHHVTQQSA